MRRTALIRSQLGRDSCSHVVFLAKMFFFFFFIVNHICESAFLSVLKSKSGKKRAVFAVSLSGTRGERARARIGSLRAPLALVEGGGDVTHGHCVM